MEEIEQATATEVYAPRSVQLWRALMNWLEFFFEILLQILRGTPCLPQVLSSIGLSHNRLLSPSFKPLPHVELPLHLEDGVATTEDPGRHHGSDHDPLKKLTVC